MKKGLSDYHTTITRIYTPEQNDTIRRMCSEGRTWREIGAAVNVPHRVVALYARTKLGVTPFQAQKEQRVVVKNDRAASARALEPLPAGHPLTWAAITDLMWPGDMV